MPRIRLIALLAATSLFAQPNGPKLHKFLVLGDSLAAGFQNFSLYQQGQQSGYAALIARQAGTELTLPLISYPGIPPAITLQAGQIVREAGFGTRINPEEQAWNLAVPGQLVSEMIAYPYPGNPAQNPIDALAANILATPSKTKGCGVQAIAGQLAVSQVLCAQGLKPKTILVSAGSNDALQALTFGLPPTPVATFQQHYAHLLDDLAETKADIVVTNIPDVTAIPFLIPVPAFQQICPTASLPEGNTAADFVVPDLANPFAASTNICSSYAVRSAALIQSAAAAVSAYNQIIAVEAARTGAVVVDLNTFIRSLGPAALPLFSLDGMHPNAQGYAVLANEIIRVMNENFRYRIPPIN